MLALWVYNILTPCTMSPPPVEEQHLKTFVCLPGSSGTSCCCLSLWLQPCGNRSSGKFGHFPTKRPRGHEGRARWSQSGTSELASEDGDKFCVSSVLLMNRSLQFICGCRRRLPRWWSGGWQYGSCLQGRFSGISLVNSGVSFFGTWSRMGCHGWIWKVIPVLLRRGTSFVALQSASGVPSTKFEKMLVHCSASCTKDSILAGLVRYILEWCFELPRPCEV